MKRTFGRLLALAAPFTGRMALAVLLGVATIGSGIGLLTTSAYLIAKAALQPSIADLQVAIVGVRFFGISRGVFRYLERLVSHDTTFRLLARLRVWFYAALEPLAPARLQHYRSGDLLARIVADVETLENLFLRVLAPPLVAVLVAALAAILVGSFHPALAVVLLGFLLLAGAGLPLLTRALSRSTGAALVGVRAELNAALVDGVQGVADLLAFGQEARHLALVDGLSRQLGDLQRRMARIGGLHSALSGLLLNLATLALLLVAIPLVSAGRLDGVYLALLVLAVLSSFEAVLPLPQAFQYLDHSLAAAQRLFEIADSASGIRDSGLGNDLVAAEFRITNPELRIQDLRFAYEPGSPPALDGLNLDLPAGGLVAVVGPSGAGKTTLLRLLLRFWEYDQGRIELGGQDLRAYPEDELRRLFAVVSQRSHLFNDTVRANLLLARPEASEAAMIEAARQAQIHEFIASLPQGYDTFVGELGVRLSGGERRRLTIARTLLQDAPVWLLDEPTADLDALTERAVMDRLHALRAGRTTLLITHRLVGLEDADEILVLRAGRVVERGRHHELMQMGGLYRRLWDLQTQQLALA